MHFAKAILVLAGAVAVQALSIPIVARQDDTTVDKIGTDFAWIAGNVTAFQTALINFKGDFITVAPVATAGNNLDAIVKSTTDDVNANGPFAADQSARIAAQAGPTADEVVKGLTLLIFQKSNFEKIGGKGLVLGQLSTLKTDADAFGVALLKQSADVDKPAFQSMTDKINAKYADVVAAYSS